MRIISFSLFGSNPTYTVGAVENVRLAAQLYPGWTCRFYVSVSVPVLTLEVLTELGAQVVPMTHRPDDLSALSWRFDALTDDADAYLFRDCDSRPDEREAAAVAEWLASGRQFHIIRDHPEHYLPMMGGLWGCTRAGAARIRNLRDAPGTRPSDWHWDQVWLRDTVYPIARTDALVHDEFGFFPSEQARPFPLPRPQLPDGGWRFVGQGFNADGTLRYPEHARDLAVKHEWRLFPEGTIPEYTRPEWYAGREHAPHLEQPGHRDRLMQTAAFVAQAAFADGLRTVVDLGAGDGGLLSLLGPSLTSWGYDLMDANLDAAKERGVDVRYGDVVDGDIEWADIAVCTEMLEHLVDPHTFVQRIAQHAPVLVCSSPWRERPTFAYEFHTWAWDLIGYRALVEQAGYRVQRQRQVHDFQVLLAVRR